MIVQRDNCNVYNNDLGTARLFVGQISFDATELDLEQLFSFYGTVLHVNLSYDHANRKMGSAFVTYGTTEEADNAILALHDRYFMGRDKPIQVSYCRRSDNVSLFGHYHAYAVSERNASNPVPPSIKFDK